MKPPDITENADLSSDWANASCAAFLRPDRHLEQLYELALRDQWRLADLNWDSVNLGGIPQPLRQSAANMFAQLHYGELAALLGASRIAMIAPNACVRKFCTTQADDEARHVQWFSALMRKLDCHAEVLPSTEALMQDVCECDSIEGLVAGIHILVEGMAHSFFLEGARAFSTCNPVTRFFAPYRAARTAIGDWLPNYLGRDESRHIAFGVRFLTGRIKDLSRPRRDVLERQVQRWCDLFVAAARDPAMLAVPGLDSIAIRDRCIHDINLRLATVGIEARIPSLAEAGA